MVCRRLVLFLTPGASLVGVAYAGISIMKILNAISRFRKVIDLESFGQNAIKIELYSKILTLSLVTVCFIVDKCPK